jgi:hypothetical protein
LDAGDCRILRSSTSIRKCGRTVLPNSSAPTGLCEALTDSCQTLGIGGRRCTAENTNYGLLGGLRALPPLEFCFGTSAPVANRINGTESLTRKGFNCLLQQNLPIADINFSYSIAWWAL